MNPTTIRNSGRKTYTSELKDPSKSEENKDWEPRAAVPTRWALKSIHLHDKVSELML